ncbi:MAG: GMC family oxidoreductase [Betaproteobacteria bacterium]
MSSSNRPFDYVIVGAGTAGCLLANRLSANPAVRVLLLEAGRKDDYLWVHVPVGYLYCIGNPRTDWMYQTEAEAGLNGRQLRYPRGKVLGGCSSINGMIYMRGQRRDYDQWAELTGDPQWGWDACLPAFLAHEDHWAGERPGHAAPGHDPSGKRPGGEWRVERQRLHWPILDAFSEAAQQAGIAATEDFNLGNNEGVGYFEVNQRSGVRWNTARGFLKPAANRPNLEIWTGALVERVLLEGPPGGGDAPLRATGVVLRPDGQGESVTVTATREVLLCAGAVATPVLLQRSGIGPAPLLQRHGVPVRLDAPGVGGNLQDHLQIRAVFRVQNTRTLNTLANSLWGKAVIGLEYLLRRSGPMSMAPSQLGAFTRSSPQQPWPNVQYHVQPLSLDAFGQPLHRFDAITASVCNLNPTSRGRVDLRSADPMDAPLIQPNYLATPQDRQVAADSLRLTRRIAAQAALAPFKPQEVRPGVQFQSDEDLARLAGDIGTTIFHPVGTCRMGRADDPLAVVDTRLRVKGVAGLRVVDASVMPTITSGNTNSPTLMIAERAAAWLIQDQA